MIKTAAAMGGVVLGVSATRAAPPPLPGWSCEFKLHKAEATSLIVNGELWCRHYTKELAHTWIMQEGEIVVPLPEQFRYLKELAIVGVSSPWGEESLIHVCWNGVVKKKMEFGKLDERHLTH
jgi:hypothetical protein